jgi:ribosome-associated heat shock protein Hsp15
MRVDKFMWCVRLTKTRSQATELVKKGKVKINGEGVKPSREVKVGDTIGLSKNNAEFEFQVKDVLPNRVGAKLAVDYILDITKPEELEKYKLYQESQRIYRNYGTGKPTKKDRRDLDDFLDW